MTIEIPSGTLRAKPASYALQVGATNTFVSEVPTMTVGVQFMAADGSPRSSVSCQVDERPDKPDMPTDENGVLHLEVPVTLDSAHVTLSDSGEQYVIALGAMDPIDTRTGMFKRLQNLGYIDHEVEYDETKLAVLRSALCLFRSHQTDISGGDDPPAVDDSVASNPAGSESTPCGCSDNAGDSPTSDDGAGGAGQAGSDDPESGAEDGPTAILQPCGSACSGLSDDGVLDAWLASRLIQAHGS
ncbi:MAG: hypothetical protein ABTD50_01675 [Polyangiaceae bacterium]